MPQTKKSREITAELIKRFSSYLREQERSPATIEKYIRDIAALSEFLNGKLITKDTLIEWKENLTKRYAAASVNTMLAAVNAFADFIGWADILDHSNVNTTRIYTMESGAIHARQIEHMQLVVT